MLFRVVAVSLEAVQYNGFHLFLLLLLKQINSYVLKK